MPLTSIESQFLMFICWNPPGPAKNKKSSKSGPNVSHDDRIKSESVKLEALAILRDAM
jgi:hypothetical protein